MLAASASTLLKPLSGDRPAMCPHDATDCLCIDDAGLRRYPDPLLTRPAPPVAGVHEEITALAAVMTGTMRSHGRLALAAPQLGVDGRVVVVEGPGGAVCLVNPRLELKGRRETVIETCLNRPGVQAVARRHRVLEVAGWDESRSYLRFELEAEPAWALQHAVDHLDGRVICAGLPALR